MSLLSPDHLRLFVSPQRVIAVRLSGFAAKRVVLKQVYASEAATDAGWHGAMAGVEAALRELANGVRKLSVVVSNHIAHYQLLTGGEDLTGDEERAFALHAFSQVFGSAAEAWDVRVTYERPGAARVACAIEVEFLEALSARADELGIKLASVQPYLAAAFNQWRGQLGNRSAWLAVAEEGRLVFALIERGGWRWLRSTRVGADWMTELPQLVAREQQLAGLEQGGSEVLVFCPETALLAVPLGSPFAVKQLQLPARAGFSPITDGPFGLALIG